MLSSSPSEEYKASFVSLDCVERDGEKMVSKWVKANEGT